MKFKPIPSSVLIFVLLLLLNFAAHTSKFQEMGLYEDDYQFLGKAINWSSKEYVSHLKSTFTEEWPQGRPLGFILPQSAAFLVGKSFGLEGLFLLGTVILTINAFLFFHIVKHWSQNPQLAMLAAIAFSLFPADTTKSYLTHMFHIQPSVLFCLIAILIFIRAPRYRWLTYLLGFGCLITYETPFSLIVLLPILTDESRTKSVWVKHFIWTTAIVLLAVGIRLFFNESRILSLGNTATLMAELIAGMVIGPVISLGLFLYGPARTVLHMNRDLILVMGVSFLCFAPLVLWGFLRWNKGRELKNQMPVTWQWKKIMIELPHWVAVWLKQIGIIWLWLMSAYLLAFTHYPPVIRYGRGTSVHISATIPAALCFAVLVWGLWRMVSGYRRLKILFLLVLVGYLSVSVGNRYSIQQDFAKSWTDQKQFWQQVVPLVADSRDGTVIFVLNHQLPEVHYIITHSWADYFLLEELIEYPDEWTRKPMVLVTDGNWERNLLVRNGKISYPWSLYWDFVIDPENIILLSDKSDGNLERVAGEIHTFTGVHMQAFPLSEEALLFSERPVKPLYELMLDDVPAN
jgi:hypothetical protein